jgi:hypothetical protein
LSPLEKEEGVNADLSVQRFGGGGSGEKVRAAGALFSTPRIGDVAFTQGATCTVTGSATTPHSQHI